MDDNLLSPSRLSEVTV